MTLVCQLDAPFVALSRSKKSLSHTPSHGSQPPRAMSRLYYDPNQPRMLTPEEIATLNPTECAALCQQVDQNILDTLQKIDDNFVGATRTVTDRLIPAVEGYGRSSKVVWDSVKVGRLGSGVSRRTMASWWCLSEV